MQLAENWRQKTIDAGHKRQTRDRGEICACRSKIAKSDQRSGDWDDPEKSDPSCRLRDRLHQSLQIADLIGRKRQQHPDCAPHITKRHNQAADEKSPGNRPACVLDLLSHERGGFTTAKGENQCRPKDHVLQTEPRRQGRSIEGRR